MNVAIISDTHDNLARIDRALELFRKNDCKVLLHAGDIVAPFALKRILTFPGTVHAVFGNCDGEKRGLKKVLPSLLPGPLRVQIDSLTFLLVHDQARLTPDDLKDVDVVVAGHTHEPEITADGHVFVNPGECAGWVTGRATVALFDTASRSARILDLGD